MQNTSTYIQTQRYTYTHTHTKVTNTYMYSSYICIKYKPLVIKTAWSWNKANEFKSLLWKPQCEFIFPAYVRLIDTDHFALVSESESGMHAGLSIFLHDFQWR